MTTRSPIRYSRRQFGQLTLAGVPAALLLRQDSRFPGVRIGVQSYSFRTMPLDEALKAMADIGIGECELWSGHVEPRPPRPPAGAPRGPSPEAREAQRKWRLETPLDHFTAIRRRFDAAGVKIQAYNLSFNENFSDEEIDRGFEMARALGAGFITASATLEAAKRVAPYADRHQMVVAMHNHSNLKDPNEFATPESFATALAMSKYFKVNLDIGHFTAANFDAVDYLEQHHADITNLHLKDRKKDQGANVVWGEGDTPIKPVLELLAQKRYDIPANIEYEYKGSDPVTEVRKCYEYCRAALA
jgi:sugar phosphate isomerase/epimerase